MYIYVSNESPQDVFFDNVTIQHHRGPLLSEDHYYPFGLIQSGISSQAAGKLETLLKYNKGSELQHKEFSDGSGLETYTTQFRMLDPQLGRWWQIDPKPDNSVSIYSAMDNNPILKNDPLGDVPGQGDGSKSDKKQPAIGNQANTQTTNNKPTTIFEIPYLIKIETQETESHVSGQKGSVATVEHTVNTAGQPTGAKITANTPLASVSSGTKWGNETYLTTAGISGPGGYSAEFGMGVDKQANFVYSSQVSKSDPINENSSHKSSHNLTVRINPVAPLAAAAIVIAGPEEVVGAVVAKLLSWL